MNPLSAPGPRRESKNFLKKIRKPCQNGPFRVTRGNESPASAGRTARRMGGTRRTCRYCFPCQELVGWVKRQRNPSLPVIRNAQDAWISQKWCESTTHRFPSPGDHSPLNLRLKRPVPLTAGLIPNEHSSCRTFVVFSGLNAL